MANISFKDAIRKLRGLKTSVELAQEAGTEAMHGYIEGELKSRIHVRGEAYDGTLIGSYRSPAYRKRRTTAGRQVQKKDLVFRGNLIRNYGRGTYRGNRVIGFFQDRYRLIAQGQQQQTGKTIFRVKPETIERGKEQYLRAYNRVLERRL